MWPAHPLIVVIIAATIGLAFAALIVSIVRTRRSLSLRTQAFSAICHDLLTPLTRLRLRTERAHETLRAGMLRDIDHMDRMLRETLDSFARESQGQTEDIDLVSLLRTICSEFTDTGYAVSYEGPERMTVRVRATALARAITNLVDNAARYGTTVHVRLSEQKRAVEVEVCDDGPGIPMDERKKVFEPFHSEHPHDTDQVRRFGLGLPIARAIAESHGGTVVLNDRYPRGLTVRFSLPRKRMVRN
jgi:signal transduction histidine kinase